MLGHRVTEPRSLGILVVQQNSLAHTQHTVDLGDAEPVKDIRHESLEPHILDAGDVFGPFEVIRRPILPAFPSVVHD